MFLPVYLQSFLPISSNLSPYVIYTINTHPVRSLFSLYISHRLTVPFYPFALLVLLPPYPIQSFLSCRSQFIIPIPTISIFLLTIQFQHILDYLLLFNLLLFSFIILTLSYFFQMVLTLSSMYTKVHHIQQFSSHHIQEYIVII